MAKSKTVVDIDSIVLQSLLKIANASGPLRLSGKGEDVVFTSTAGANKEAIIRLKDAGLPLVIEIGNGKAATVGLTPAGFERIATQLSLEKIATVAEGLSNQLSPSERVMFLQGLVNKSPQSVSALVPLLEKAATAEKIATEARLREAENQRAAEAATLEALERWKALLQQRNKLRVDALRKELAIEGVEEEELVLSKPTKPINPETRTTSLTLPSDSEDLAFRRNVARRLVSSWVESWEKNKLEAREFLESAIWNISGFKPVGEVDQRLSFDGRYHEGGSNLFTGDLVKIVRPGWLFEEADDNEYVVLKAQVSKP